MSELINPGTTPQVYSKDGKTIGAGERLGVDKLDTVGKAAVSGGRLVFEEDTDKDADAGTPEATEAETSADTGKSTNTNRTTATARRSPGSLK